MLSRYTQDNCWRVNLPEALIAPDETGRPGCVMRTTLGPPSRLLRGFYGRFELGAAQSFSTRSLCHCR
jgi:hypothetical protein